MKLRVLFAALMTFACIAFSPGAKAQPSTSGKTQWGQMINTANHYHGTPTASAWGVIKDTSASGTQYFYIAGFSSGTFSPIPLNGTGNMSFITATLSTDTTDDNPVTAYTLQTSFDGVVFADNPNVSFSSLTATSRVLPVTQKVDITELENYDTKLYRFARIKATITASGGPAVNQCYFYFSQD